MRAKTFNILLAVKRFVEAALIYSIRTATAAVVTAMDGENTEFRDLTLCLTDRWPHGLALPNDTRRVRKCILPARGNHSFGIFIGKYAGRWPAITQRF